MSRRKKIIIQAKNASINDLIINDIGLLLHIYEAQQGRLENL